MAKLIKLAIFSLSLLFIAIASAQAYEHELDDPEMVWFQNAYQGGKETLVRIHFYVQDFLTGHNATVFEVARANITSNSLTTFGQVRVMDDLFTIGPDVKSQPMGRMQGVVTSSDMETSALMMNLNFHFTTGEYNGSTICLLGRNQIFNTRRELALVGGTGKFRMARGYAITSTYSLNTERSYVVLEHTLYVAYIHREI